MKTTMDWLLFTKGHICNAK